MCVYNTAAISTSIVLLAECPTVCNTEKRLPADSASLAIFSCLTSTRNSLCTEEYGIGNHGDTRTETNW